MNVQELVAKGARSKTRRAALAVHAMSAFDRTWLLAQLPEDERARLESMLSELRALGIPVDGALLAELLEPVAVISANTPSADEDPAGTGQRRMARQIEELCRLDAHAVLKALDKEPAGFVARVLHVHAWPWRDSVVEQLGPVKRRLVEDHLDKLRRGPGAPLPEALCSSLLNALHVRTGEMASGADPAAAAVWRAGGLRATSWARWSMWQFVMRRRGR